MPRIIEWFVNNAIAANLLMILIFVGGVSSISSLNKEVFPKIESNTISIIMAYPGAGPTEVEELIVKRIEEAVADLDGIEKISSNANMGLAEVFVEAVNGFDPQKLLNDIKGRVDAISTFPSDAERPVISESLWLTEVMSVAIFGEVDEVILKKTAQWVQDEMSLLPDISKIDMEGHRDDEMAIEISEQQMRRYNISFDQVVEALRSASINLPAGTVKSMRGDIQVQTRGQAYSAQDFEKIVIETREDGALLYLGDIASVSDGFTEWDVVSQLNGKPAVVLNIFMPDDPDILTASAQVKAYVSKLQEQLPQGVEAAIWRDWSTLFKGRMNLLLGNSATGLMLVFIVLMLFLRPALAVWVCIGIAIAFMGTLWLLPKAGVNIHMISLFSFLLVLGIVVDDAIIVSESIYSQQKKGVEGLRGAAIGANGVAKPVLFAVISTIIFFVPMLFIPGGMGDMSYSIPVVVCLALFFSLVESLLILPSHLAYMKPENPNPKIKWLRKFERARERLSDTMQHAADSYYRPALAKMLNNNGATISCFVVAFGLALAAYNGGWLSRSFMPNVPSDFINVSAKIPEGSPFSETTDLLAKVESAIEVMRTDEKLLAENDDRPFIKYVRSWAWDNNIWVSLILEDGETRTIGSSRVGDYWRELLGDLPETEEFNLASTINNRNKAIRLEISLATADEAIMAEAVEQIRSALQAYPGVNEIKDSLTGSRTEIELDLKYQAESLGLSLSDIARQVRYGFYGAEVQRIPRGKEDVKVLVRYPKAERQRVEQLDEMRIRTPDNREIPLATVAEIAFVPGYSTIKRLDRRRNITITAEVEEGSSDPTWLVMDLLERNTPQWRKMFPGIKLSIDGDMKDENRFMDSLAKNFILAMLIIYCLMAVAFSSYWQPVLILTAIPFGFMGAIAGHLIMDKGISMMSMLGFLACAGVVVNDNLVLLDRINQLRDKGLDVFNAVLDAGADRFRPIILTSITTFIGLVPIMAETSTQAQFLIPMVISLSFGVLFATTVTLILVPSLFFLAERAKAKISGNSEHLTVNISP